MIKKIILLLHGDMDEAIPIENGLRLYEAATAKKYYHKIEGGGHNNLYDFNIEEVIKIFVKTSQI